jgi:hypothetical protein
MPDGSCANIVLNSVIWSCNAFEPRRRTDRFEFTRPRGALRMSVFEFLLALYAIVAGLGISLLVTSIGQMIEARDRVRLYWVHLCWIALVFVAHVISWFMIWQFHDHSGWTVLEALLLLAAPILLYLISHLAVPDLEDGRVHDMREYYFRHARWSQGLLLGMVVAGALAHLVIEDGYAITGARGMRLAIAAILLPGLFTLNPRVHAAQALLLALTLLLAVSWVSRPIA